MAIKFLQRWLCLLLVLRFDDYTTSPVKVFDASSKSCGQNECTKPRNTSTCGCDEQCSLYGDCCHGSSLPSTHTHDPDIQCVNVFGTPLHLISGCPDGTLEDIAGSCNQSLTEVTNVQLMNLPLRVKVGPMVYYKNGFCLQCKLMPSATELVPPGLHVHCDDRVFVRDALQALTYAIAHKICWVEFRDPNIRPCVADSWSCMNVTHPAFEQCKNFKNHVIKTIEYGDDDVVEQVFDNIDCVKCSGYSLEDITCLDTVVNLYPNLLKPSISDVVDLTALTGFESHQCEHVRGGPFVADCMKLYCASGYIFKHEESRCEPIGESSLIVNICNLTDTAKVYNGKLFLNNNNNNTNNTNSTKNNTSAHYICDANNDTAYNANIQFKGLTTPTEFYQKLSVLLHEFTHKIADMSLMTGDYHTVEALQLSENCRRHGYNGKVTDTISSALGFIKSSQTRWPWHLRVVVRRKTEDYISIDVKVCSKKMNTCPYMLLSNVSALPDNLQPFHVPDLGICSDLLVPDIVKPDPDVDEPDPGMDQPDPDLDVPDPDAEAGSRGEIPDETDAGNVVTSGALRVCFVMMVGMIVCALCGQ